MTDDLAAQVSKYIFESTSINTMYQEDEIASMAAIFGPDWRPVHGDDMHAFALCLRADNCTHELVLRIVLPERYPSEQAPLYEVDTRGISGTDLPHIAEQLDLAYATQVRLEPPTCRCGDIVSSQASPSCTGGPRGSRSTSQRCRWTMITLPVELQTTSENWMMTATRCDTQESSVIAWMTDAAAR